MNKMEALSLKKPSKRSVINVMLDINYLCNSLLKIKKFRKHKKEMQEDKVSMRV